jgi:hypothetical protein
MHCGKDSRTNYNNCLFYQYTIIITSVHIWVQETINFLQYEHSLASFISNF